MSFLAGRLAAKEGAYFLQESKQAVTRLRQSPQTIVPDKPSPFSPPPPPEPSPSPSPDVLPEVLKHSLLSKVYSPTPTNPSSLARPSKWVVPSDHASSAASPDALNPLRAYVALPQVTFGPKRWDLPHAEHSVSASTANELRQDRYQPVDPAKLKAAAEGLAYVGKAFAAATVIVFGGASLILGLAASKLQVQNSDDLRAKGRDLIQPKFDMIKEQVVPLRKWAESTSQRWHRVDDAEQSQMVMKLSKTLGPKTS
ncbi:hypothetical protein MLD38_003035 [Melastoma candidum]|uniref:Uncharacterized protein n=1 Tax=Melastoma candidum TaxID=119954 RepID=A0ACB9S9V6_9MYRT|nr:hypothetical protein MLD38_003035 [Melastoma candidum]